MTDYRAPIRAVRTALGAAGLDEVLELPPFAELAPAVVEDVLEAYGDFVADVVAPTDAIGDREGARLDPDTGEVTVAPEVRDAYLRLVRDGWVGLSAPAELGGGGMPRLVATAAEEMFTSANMALSLNQMLTQGAVELLVRWGDEAQRRRYLPKLVTGEWTGTMALTEPDAGSDLAGVRTRAEPLGDGRWSITGTKIFITWGEHDLADNIVHFVLARTPGAPAGSRGISLFAVPRRLVDDDGTLGGRNAVRCVGLEHKLGIHSSPTCVMELDGAVGEMVGEEHRGLPAMFTMMNSARHSVGLEGLGISERAFQAALAYARERHQGRAPGTEAGTSSPIVDHPDVRRNLMLVASGIDAMRMLLYATAAATDLSRHHPDEARRAVAAARVDLLTPIAKAWSTDEGVRLSSVALQVHGGYGYMEESGMPQRLRDARIAPIYEGTNGIQAIDLAGRKVRRDRGAALGKLVAELSAEVEHLDSTDELKHAGALLGAALDALQEATKWLVDAEDEADWLAAATPYLDLAALATVGGLLARQVTWAREHAPAEHVALAGRFRFFALERLAAAPGLVEAIVSGARRLDPTLLPGTAE